jgi:hypothetical protein
MNGEDFQVQELLQEVPVCSSCPWVAMDAAACEHAAVEAAARMHVSNTVRMHVRACARACVCACVRVHVRACARACVQSPRFCFTGRGKLDATLAESRMLGEQGCARAGTRHGFALAPAWIGIRLSPGRRPSIEHGALLGAPPHPHFCRSSSRTLPLGHQACR